MVLSSSLMANLYLKLYLGILSDSSKTMFLTSIGTYHVLILTKHSNVILCSDRHFY